jgi:O-antigen/teichoic acid export membrane protein
VYNKLVIPLERRIAAIRVYQFSVFSFVFSLLSSPYMAMIIAREDMNIYAYVSIVEVFLKLAIAFVLRFIAMDKLLLYGFFVLIATIATTAVYGIISVKRYKECRTFFCWNKDLIGKMLSFSLWNMFGSSVSIFKNQIINIMLNQFFNPIVIAARSIAMNVDSAVMSLSNNFSTAIRPQIIKYYASEQREKMLLLVFRGAKCTYLLLYVFFLPLMLELPQVLEIWLKNPPEYTVVFTRLMLIDVLITSISYPLMTASQATGKIKLYQAVVGGLLLLNVPVSLLVLSFGTPPQSVLVVAIVIALIATIARLIIVRQLIDFSISQYLLKVILPIIVISIVSSIPSILIYFLLDKSFLRLCFVTVVSIFSICILSYYIALNKSERLKLKEIVSNYIHPRKVQK